MLSDFEQKKEETEPSTEVETEVSTVEADEKEDSNDEKSSEVQSEEVANPSEAEPEEILVEQPVTPVIVEPTQPLNDEESAPAVKPVTAKTVTESENEDDEEELYVATPKSSGGSGFGLGFLVGIIVGLAIGACAAYFAIDYINPTPSPTVILPVEDEIAEEIDSMTTLVTEPTDSVADPVTQESEAEVTSPALSPEPVEEKTAKPSQPETPQPTETTKSSASVKDTVKPGYNLAKMALHHYGAKNFWVYIYEENKDKIKNPNNLPAGLVLVIPPASKYGIDPKNPASLQAAKEKEAQIVSKHSNK
ncbi:MAG: hypothetical protein K2K55_00365 [Duncaniella sp.]|nr:hypothetical protein [Duncaniella sp.]